MEYINKMKLIANKNCFTALKKAPLINKIIAVCDILSFFILRNYGLLNGLMAIFLIACLMYVIYADNRMVIVEQSRIGFLSKILLHVYFVSALAANRIFMSEALMTLGVVEFGNFVMVSLALWPFGTILFHIFDEMKSHIRKREITYKQIRKVRIISFFIIFSILILMTLGFYPATMSVDGVSHWTQAVGYLGWRIQDNTSAAFTILLRMCYKIWNSPYGFILLILFLFSVIFARILTYFFVKGVSAKVIYCISAIIALLPNNYMTLVSIKTNSLYAILCLWVTYLLIRLIDNPEKTGRSARFITEISIILPCLYVCRHNSFLAVFGTCSILLFECIQYSKRKKKVGFHFIIPIVATLVIIKVITGPIYAHFDVIKNASPEGGQVGGLAYPLISPLAVAYNNGIELTEDTLEYMDRIRPLEYWSNHNPYHGDTFVWSEPLPQYGQVHGYAEVFKYYFKLLFSRPDIVIKDRLDGIESLWNVFGGEISYNTRFFLGIHTNMPEELVISNGWNRNISTVGGNRVYFNETVFTKIPYALCNLFKANKTLDALIWRTGFSIIIAFYALYYNYMFGKKEKIMAAIPMIGTLITLILVISWQIYQYFWVVHIINWFLVFYFILPVDSKSIQNE